jgi:acetyl-CoA/propionyl-CoA carboxylase biotin carboxyl carrier protein
VRSDFGVSVGDEVTLHYDSMLGKILAWGPDRHSARRRLEAALAELRIDGVGASPEFLRRLLALPEFIEARHHVGTLEDQLDELSATLAPNLPQRQGRVRTVTLPWGTQKVTVAIGSRQDIGAAPPRAVRTLPGQEAAAAGAAGLVTAPMDATVSRLLAHAGAPVEAGMPLMVLEAMKMELVVHATCSGTLRSIEVAAGAWVPSGAPLAAIDPDS